MKLEMANLSDIHIGERFRKDLGDIDALAESLKSKGFITPIAVKRTQTGGLALLAGGRRCAAAELAEIEQVPVRIYERDLTEFEIRAIELEENIQRKDLEWMEKVNLQREIHQLYTKIHGPKHSTSPDATGWSMRDTASLMGVSLGSISTDVKLAKAVETMPNVDWQGCRNKSEAMKTLNRIEEAAIKEELVRRAKLTEKQNGKLGAADSRRQKLIDSYIVGDFLKSVKKLDPETFNLVEIDPPYAIGYQNRVRRKASFGYNFGENGYNEISADDYLPFLAEVFRECHRVMAQHSWMLVWFAASNWYSTIYQAIIDAGFECNKLPAIWIKSKGQTSHPETVLASTWEPFWYARKGSPKLAKPGSTNTFFYSAPDKRIHPTERPIEMMKDILSTFTWPNARVLVPFAGSGNTLRAAHELDMHALGFDLGREYKDSYVVRIMEEM